MERTIKSKVKAAPRILRATVVERAGDLAAVQEGSGRYPFKVVRPHADGRYDTLSQGYSSEAEVRADLRLRTGSSC